MTESPLFFWGHTAKKSIGPEIYSNWYPVKFSENDVEFSNTEQYMMAGKAKLFNDLESYEKILQTSDPKKCKSLGRKVKNFDEKTWRVHRCDIVTQGCYLKFSQNENLKKEILSTKDRELVEASPFDRIWGIGMSKSEAENTNRENWKGSNLLGVCLMRARERIRENL